MLVFECVCIYLDCLIVVFVYLFVISVSQALCRVCEHHRLKLTNNLKMFPDFSLAHECVNFRSRLWSDVYARCANICVCVCIYVAIVFIILHGHRLKDGNSSLVFRFHSIRLLNLLEKNSFRSVCVCVCMSDSPLKKLMKPLLIVLWRPYLAVAKVQMKTYEL